MIEHLNDLNVILSIWKPFTKELGIPYKDYIQKHIDNNTWFCYKVGNNVAGIVTYTVYNKKRDVEVESLIVLPEYRNQGISTKLIYHVYKEAESLIKTLGYAFRVDAQEGLPNNDIYHHLSTNEVHYTSRSGKTKLVLYDLNVDYLINKFENASK